MTDHTVSGRKRRGDERPADDSPIENLREQLAARSGKRMDSKEVAQQRLELLTSLNRTSRTFADTMRVVTEERRRFAEEREQLLKRERAARAEAETARERLHEVLESIDDAFFTLDRRWCFSYANDRVVNLAGRPREELLGKSVQEVFPELVGDVASAKLIMAEEQGNATQFEHYSPKLNRWLRHRVYPSRAGLSVYTTDITEQKSAEEELKRREELYRLIAENSTDMISKHTPEGVYTYASPACRSLLGYEPEELVGRSAYDFFHPEDLEAIKETHSAILNLPDTYTVSYRIRRKDDSYIWFETTSRTIRDPETDAVQEILATSRDISKRKRIEEEKLRLAEHVNLLLESTDEGIFGLNLEGICTFINRSAVQMLGYDGPEEFLGKNIHEICHHSYKDGSPYPIEVCPIYQAFRAGRGVRIDGEVFWRRDGSSFPVEYSAYPVIEDGVIRGSIATFVDITERKRTEKERERLLAREWTAHAEAAERRKISRDLHDRVAHSMGVVHQSLQLYRVLLPRDPSKAEAKLALAQEMAKAALDSTRNLAMALRNPVAEGDLEGALSSFLESSVPPDIETELSVEGDESSVPAHVREQLFLILREAVRNAVAHSECGQISVCLEIIPEKITGAVEDDGRGFDPEGSANGGGLKSMKERTALVGGTCSVRSEPNGGTRVQVSIPLPQER